MSTAALRAASTVPPSAGDVFSENLADPTPLTGPELPRLAREITADSATPFDAARRPAALVHHRRRVQLLHRRPQRLGRGRPGCVPGGPGRVLRAVRGHHGADGAVARDPGPRGGRVHPGPPGPRRVGHPGHRRARVARALDGVRGLGALRADPRCADHHHARVHDRRRRPGHADLGTNPELGRSRPRPPASTRVGCPTTARTALQGRPPRPACPCGGSALALGLLLLTVPAGVRIARRRRRLSRGDGESAYQEVIDTACRPAPRGAGSHAAGHAGRRHGSGRLGRFAGPGRDRTGGRADPEGGRVAALRAARGVRWLRGLGPGRRGRGVGGSDQACRAAAVGPADADAQRALGGAAGAAERAEPGARGAPALGLALWPATCGSCAGRWPTEPAGSAGPWRSRRPGRCLGRADDARSEGLRVARRSIWACAAWHGGLRCIRASPSSVTRGTLASTLRGHER